VKSALLAASYKPVEAIVEDHSQIPDAVVGTFLVMPTGRLPENRCARHGIFEYKVFAEEEALVLPLGPERGSCTRVKTNGMRRRGKVYRHHSKQEKFSEIVGQEKNSSRMRCSLRIDTESLVYSGLTDILE
jgi:hypothetical protein